MTAVCENISKSVVADLSFHCNDNGYYDANDDDQEAREM